MEKLWLKSYPKGVPNEIDMSSYSSLVEVLKQSVKKFATKPAVSNLGRTLTFEDVDELSDCFAAFLQKKCGLKKGDRIAIQMPNILQFPIALFGALKAGLIVVNTNPLYTEREMEHQFKDSGAKAIVILANFADKLESILDKTDIEHVIITELGDMLKWPKRTIVNLLVKHVKKMVPKYHIPNAYNFWKTLVLGSAHDVEPVTLTLDDLAFLQYTGGTTGVSKGAMLSHGNIVANMEQISAWIGPKLTAGEEVVVTPLPLYHIFSLTVNCFAFFKYGGHAIYITNPRDLPAFAKELSKWPFTVITGINTLFNALANHPDIQKLDFSHLKISVAGGMALQQAVAESWEKVTGTRVVEGYGLTEASPVLSCGPVDGTDRVGTIGLPLPSTDIKIIDDEGNEVPFGESGELCGKGPQIMKGYWERPDETDNVLTKDGWLKTGDIAICDDTGTFKIVDRKKDMILVSGFNVYPNEIEDVAVKHPGVLEVAAIGVPDDKSGEAVKIFVVKQDASLTEDQVIAHCKELLTGYKVPKHVEFREELPKSNVGKILRRLLKEENQK